jgi:hypothetical protein
MDNFSILMDANTGSFANTNVGVQLADVPWSSFENIAMRTGSAPNRVNQGMVFIGCTSVDVNVCDIAAYVNPVYVTNGTAVVAVRSSSLSANAGSGQPYGACLLMDHVDATANLTVWLPTSKAAGREVTVKRGDNTSSTVVVAPAAGAQVEGGSRTVALLPHTAVTCVSDGTSWWVTGFYSPACSDSVPSGLS